MRTKVWLRAHVFVLSAIVAVAAIVSCVGDSPTPSKPSDGGNVDAPPTVDGPSGPPTKCSFTDASADFCDDFDDTDKAPLWRWTTVEKFANDDGGASVGPFAAVSSPNALRIAVEQKTDHPDDGGGVGALVQRLFPGTAKKMRIDFDFRLDQMALPDGGSDGAMTVLAILNQGAAATLFSIQLEARSSSTEPAPALGLRMFQETTLLKSAPLDAGVAVGTWQHYQVLLETEGDGLFVTIRRQGTLVADRVPFSPPPSAGQTGWNLWLGGFSSGVPPRVRPAIVQTYDNVAVELDP